jgi:hypothetical protein
MEEEIDDPLVRNLYPTPDQALQNLSADDSTPRISHGFVGRPSLAMVPGVKEFVESILFSCSAAQNRRRNTNRTVVGASLKELRDLLLSKFPLIRSHFPSLSTNTVRNLGLAPNISHTHGASAYHGTIDMKKLNVENNYFPDTPKKHDSFAQVGLILEQLFYCSGLGDKGITIISLDDAAEEHLGACVLTNRHHQVRRMSLTSAPPMTVEGDYYEDKLTPCGYLVLKLEQFDLNKEAKYCHPSLKKGHYGTYLDKENRIRIVRSHDGPLTYYYTAQKLFPVILETHLAHVYEVSPASTRFLALICDKGADNNFEFEVNFFQYGRYWKDQLLDGLVVLSYAFSAFNDIEHKHSDFKKNKAGLNFPFLTREGLKPKTNEERLEVYNSVIDQLIPIDSKVLICNQPTTSKNGNFTENFYDDYAAIRKLFDSPRANTNNSNNNNNNNTDDESRKLYKFLVAHCIFTKWFVLFLRCNGLSCTHCSQLGDISTTRNLMEQLNSQGRSFFVPTQKDNAHFFSFIDLLALNQQQQQPAPTSIRPNYFATSKLISGNWEFCDDCACFLFTSQKAKFNHWHLVHDGKPTFSFLTGQYSCSVCREAFDTQSQLRKHKSDQNHYVRRKGSAPQAAGDRAVEKDNDVLGDDSELSSTDSGGGSYDESKLRTFTPESLVGKRIRVWWADYEDFFVGTVSSVHSGSRGSHVVLYDDDGLEYFE